MPHTIAVFYGGSTSHTDYVAYEIQEFINNLKANSVLVYNNGHCKAEPMKQVEVMTV